MTRPQLMIPEVRKMGYPAFPEKEDLERCLPWKVILAHCVIDLTEEELEESGELKLLEHYRDSAVETAMDYQNGGFSLESRKTQQAVLLMIASMWRNREDSREGKISNLDKWAAQCLMDYRREGIL